jgi:hypothetical protein
VLANPFLGCQDHKFFTDAIKDRCLIFAIFEAEVTRREIELLHVAKISIWRFKRLKFEKIANTEMFLLNILNLAGKRSING